MESALESFEDGSSREIGLMIAKGNNILSIANASEGYEVLKENPYPDADDD